jgi:hypothetical protein
VCIDSNIVPCGLISPQGISTLAHYGLDSKEVVSSREALRCLANALLLNESSRQTFIDMDYAGKAAERLKADNHDDEFLISRILFLLTYNTNLDFGKMIDKHGLDSSVNRNIAHHARSYQTTARKHGASSPIQDMAMHETLKLLFNVTYHHPGLAVAFAPSFNHLVHILINYEIRDPPLQPPVTLLINALLNLELKADPVTSNNKASEETRGGISLHRKLIDRLIIILDRAVRSQTEKELDQAAAPLCTLLRQLYALDQPDVQTKMKTLLLPADSEREVPLGQADSLPSRLLRMSTSSDLPMLRDNISSLLFELSDKDASKFVENIGYGYASGYLMNHRIPIPAGPIPAARASDTAQFPVDKAFNPVTGQHLSAEDQTAAQALEMTEEEKEREAERLFVLFERLKATGVINVTNPVEHAISEGRFEEVD